MIEFVAAMVVIGLAMFAMALGVICRGRQIKSSCGGLNNLRKILGFTPCEGCTDPSPDCPLRSQKRK